MRASYLSNDKLTEPGASGTTATKAMTHIASQEQVDGKIADWMEKVSDEQCRA